MADQSVTVTLPEAIDVVAACEQRAAILTAHFARLGMTDDLGTIRRLTAFATKLREAHEFPRDADLSAFETPADIAYSSESWAASAALRR